jgi:hypothetical protein
MKTIKTIMMVAVAICLAAMCVPMVGANTVDHSIHMTFGSGKSGIPVAMGDVYDGHTFFKGHAGEIYNDPTYTNSFVGADPVYKIVCIGNQSYVVQTVPGGILTDNST